MVADKFKINQEWLSCPTGDPFADAGGYAFEEFSKHYPNCNVMQLIEKLTDIYINKWDSKINAFFLNSKITQSKFDSKKKKEETLKYFNELLNESTKNSEGFCRILGKKTSLFVAGRDNSILTGSGKFVNFHHYFQTGIMLSKEAIIRLFFLPLACELLEGSIALIHSNVPSFSSPFASKNCRSNLLDIASGISDGVRKSSSNAPGTALFRYVDEVISEYNDSEMKYDVALKLYMFSNFGAEPDIEIYSLPSTIFYFYRTMHNVKNEKQWNSFVNGYYFNSKEYKKAVYDEPSNTYIASTKENQVNLEECSFKFWRNKIYENLLIGKSLIPEFLKYSRKNKLNFQIIELYSTKVFNMKKETISKINQMAEFILSSCEDSEINKVIRKLDGIKNPSLLRRFVVKDVVAKNFNKGNKEAILTIEEYTEYLFPDTNSWREIRDVLLIALYQKMHERNMSVEIELDEDINE